MKRQVPIVICFLTGVLMVAQYYILPMNFLGKMFTGWFNSITAFAYVLGAASLFLVNGKKIRDRAPDWVYSVVLLLSLSVTLYIGLFNEMLGLGYPGHRPIAPGTSFNWMFKYIYTPLSATMYSLLAFFIASASYRAFRARSVEASLLLASAFLVMIFRVPLGEFLWTAYAPESWNISWFIDTFIMGAFNNAGQRAIQVAAAIGLISVSLKIILGIERSYLGGD